MEPVIEINKISKRYNITHMPRGYVSLREVISEIGKKPFSYIKRKAKVVMGKTTREDFWALRDVSFTVNKGEAIGIIGPNGAGKSTLLKILSQITPPTEGNIKITGKVASLLEVGTGFHPELTGRENIFLNSAILGMSQREIIEKFDDIVAFAGVEKFIDTQVKRYSSGMYVRLAFAVAAHIDPDILLVDEVLAVGDAEFQKKCLGKMEEVSGKAGRTIIFVSHNMDAINRLCQKCILLKQGRIVAFGKTNEIIGKYLSEQKNSGVDETLPLTDKEITLNEFSVTQQDSPTDFIVGEHPFCINLDFSVSAKIRSFRTGVYIKNPMGTVITRTFAQDFDPALEEIEPGHYKTKLTVPARLLLAGPHDIELKIFSFGGYDYLRKYNLSKRINIHSPKNYNAVRSKNTDTVGYFLIPNSWETTKN